MKQKQPQEYTPDEFDAVVSLIKNDPDVRADIEAITGQKLNGKTPREMFDLFRAIQGATQVQQVVIQYGRARRELRRTRADMAKPMELPQSVADYVTELQAKVDDERRKRLAAEAALKQVKQPGLVGLPTTRKAAG